MRIVGFFCEDIRAESAGTETVVGIVPDTVAVPSESGAISRLAVYLRIIVEADDEPTEIVATMHTPAGEKVALGIASKALVTEAKSSAAKKNLPYGGIILRAVIAPFPVKKTGIFTVVCRSGNVEQICAQLNVEINPNASSLPSSQSQPASPQTLP